MHMFYRVMKGMQFAANLLSYTFPPNIIEIGQQSTSDLVIAKSKRVNFFWNTVYIIYSLDNSSRKNSESQSKFV